jgi:hypothetical protein
LISTLRHSTTLYNIMAHSTVRSRVPTASRNHKLT